MISLLLVNHTFFSLMSVLRIRVADPVDPIVLLFLLGWSGSECGFEGELLEKWKQARLHGSFLHHKKHMWVAFEHRLCSGSEGRDGHEI